MASYTVPFTGVPCFSFPSAMFFSCLHVITVFQGHSRVYISCSHHCALNSIQTKGSWSGLLRLYGNMRRTRKINISYCIQSISCNCSVSCSTSYRTSLPSAVLCLPFIVLTFTRHPRASSVPGDALNATSRGAYSSFCEQHWFWWCCGQLSCCFSNSNSNNNNNKNNNKLLL